MEKDDGAGVSANSLDTLALAYFLNGNDERVVDLQKEVLNGPGNAAFMGRLRRYEGTVARTANKTAPRKEQSK